MRRSALAVVLLLAAAPIAGATEITPEVKPELRAVEVAVPAIRKQVVVAPAHADEVRNVSAARARQMDRESWTIVLIAAAVIAVTLLFF